MTKPHFPEIKTERLELKRLLNTDWKMISFLRSDKRVNEFVKRPSTDTQEQALEFIAKINRGIDNNDIFYWKITEKKQNKMIGTICLWNFTEDKTVAEIGYDLSPTFQGHGFMNEALQGVIDFGFRILKLETVEAYTHLQNIKSKILLERNGFVLLPNKTDESDTDNIIYALSNPTPIHK
ncbi:MAG: GNAT family N-acetyltransferase [Cyclobacteriaceae bacterium]|nr:GNAT family N-acetyltransferase [Cyclobacteriaceae bacterium SS2]